MVTINQISQFIESQPIALIGASRNPRKFGHVAFKELKSKGMKVIPVNPNAEEILGEKAFKNISELPPEVRAIIVLTKKSLTASIVREARERGIKQIWIQQMADSPEALAELKGSDINYIVGECILMHYKANGIHKFHAGLKKFFGRYPK